MQPTVLLTGGTGYIGSWICKYLLEAGYRVRVTVRDLGKPEKFAHLKALETGTQGALEFWEADLLQSGQYDDAAKGCETIFHVASPFILQVKDAQKDLVDPALLGTRNVLEAANRSGTVKKVVLTSSVVSIYGDAKEMTDLGLDAFTEANWNTTSSLTHQPYAFSKVTAEKAAWEMAKAQDQWKLVVLNPGFVMGPSLTENSDSESITLMKDYLKGKFATGVPNVEFGLVDVRDVALAHVRAAENPQAEGRTILSNTSVSMLEISKMIKKVRGSGRGLPFMIAPKFVIKLIGFLFGITAEFVEKNVNYPLRFDNTKSKQMLGLEYRPIEETMGDMVRQLTK
jgi:dihydroflavonol-4-reductase